MRKGLREGWDDENEFLAVEPIPSASVTQSSLVLSYSFTYLLSTWYASGTMLEVATEQRSE